MRRKPVPACVCLIALGLMLTGHVNAKVDPEIILGVWLFDEDKGAVAEDASGNERIGSIKGAKWDEGQFGSALNFAKGDTVSIPLGNGIIKDRFSVVLWIQFTDLDAQQNYFSIFATDDTRTAPYKTDGNNICFWSVSWNICTGVMAEKDAWYHIANICDGETISVYVDGELKASGPGEGFLLPDLPQTAWVASHKGGSHFASCVVDEVGLFKGPLTANEVEDIMNHGISWVLGEAPVKPQGKLSTIWGKLKTQN